jgi:hypothetical protein
MNKFKTLMLLIAVFVFSFLGTFAATLVRAHGGDPSLIHACVKTNNGSIRIISASGTCGQGETPLDWSIQSPSTGLNITIRSQAFPPEATDPMIVNCLNGEVATGGGFWATGSNTHNFVASYPYSLNSSIPTGWQGRVNPSLTPADRPSVTVYVVCAAP